MCVSEILRLFDQYSNMMYRLAYSYLHHQQDSEDAVQSVFLKLIDGRAHPEPGKERAFLTQVTVNHCKDVRRRVWNRRVDPLVDTIPFEEDKDLELFHAVMGLAKKYRVAVHLHYYEGYTFAEIAAFLNVRTSTVSMRIHRARKILKQKLKEDCL